MEPGHNRNVFPVEVFSIVPLSLLFANLVAQEDRKLRLGFFYPIIVFMLGVATPFYIIVKDKKMKKILLKIIFENPKIILSNIVLFSKQCRLKSVSPFVVNE